MKNTMKFLIEIEPGPDDSGTPRGFALTIRDYLKKMWVKSLTVHTIDVLKEECEADG